ncbi:MAG: tRNA (adenosine(37)-N6)-threonylcarbamoyltransferase complex ATPase subunit type 1 TsaE [Flavobacteriales bacterium]|nr:tRNA (adenosine(37)-N6)-threonylcarbamoyltransferase complex ATPase subunit type 1 TsaE [Flavobacteriales bacterium]
MSAIMVMRQAEDVNDLAAALLHVCKHKRVFTFSGELGAGKTTLIKAMCAELGVEDGTSSPSFGIVNEYEAADRSRICHFDLYRLKDASELDGIGFEEYLDSGDHCLVEWPEVAAGRIPSDAVRVQIRVNSDGSRTILLDV